jgi:alpha-beta hydrolase superfamily lysophospholipase
MKPFVDAPFDSIRDDIEDIYFKSGDDMLNAGMQLQAEINRQFYIATDRAKTLPTIRKRFDFLHQNGYGFFVPDYTGHGKKAAENPMRTRFIKTLDNALKYLRETKTSSEDKIIIWEGLWAEQSQQKHQQDTICSV